MFKQYTNIKILKFPEPDTNDAIVIKDLESKETNKKGGKLYNEEKNKENCINTQKIPVQLNPEGNEEKPDSKTVPIASEIISKIDEKDGKILNENDNSQIEVAQNKENNESFENKSNLSIMEEFELAKSLQPSLRKDFFNLCSRRLFDYNYESEEENDRTISCSLKKEEEPFLIASEHEEEDSDIEYIGSKSAIKNENQGDYIF